MRTQSRLISEVFRQKKVFFQRIQSRLISEVFRSPLCRPLLPQAAFCSELISPFSALFQLSGPQSLSRNSRLSQSNQLSPCHMHVSNSSLLSGIAQALP